MQEYLVLTRPEELCSNPLKRTLNWHSLQDNPKLPNPKFQASTFLIIKPDYKAISQCIQTYQEAVIWEQYKGLQLGHLFEIRSQGVCNGVGM